MDLSAQGIATAPDKINDDKKLYVKIAYTAFQKRTFFFARHLNVYKSVLAYPKDKVLSILDTDDSQNSIGPVLYRIQQDQEYLSQNLGNATRNYCVVSKKLLGLVKFYRMMTIYKVDRVKTRKKKIAP